MGNKYYMVEDEIPSTDILDQIAIEGSSVVVSSTDKRSARHYENYAPYVDNPFSGKHQPEPHYTRYHYPYDPHHNPHQYTPDEHYPINTVNYHSSHKRKRRSPDLGFFGQEHHQPLYSTPRIKPAHHSAPPTHHEFAPQFNNPGAYGERPHYPDHDFPLQHNNPSGYGKKHGYPDVHLDLKYNNPAFYAKDPHHKPHKKRHAPYEGQFLNTHNAQYGRISYGGSTHFLFPRSFNRKM